MFGDAILVPVTEVGSLAVGVGWLSACAAYIARRRRDAVPERVGDGGVARRGGRRGHRADEGRSRRARQLHARRVDRVRGVVSLWAGVLARSTPVGTAASACATNASCGRRAQDFDLLVHHRLRHAGDAIAPREVGELGRFHRKGGDVRVGERHFVREADRPRAVRSRRGREHLHRHRPVDGGDALRGFRRSAASRRRRPAGSPARAR